MSILFIDTETNGLPLWREHDDHPAQPHICQLAVLMTTDTGKEMLSFNSLIYPEGWDIGEDAGGVHGITVKQCEDYGLPISEVLSLLESIADPIGTVKVIAGHNISFDMKMINIASLRTKKKQTELDVDRETFCTMKSSTNLCQLPGNYGYKWPKLSEAYKFFFNEELAGAHDALVDLRACMRIYFELKRREQEQANVK